MKGDEQEEKSLIARSMSLLEHCDGKSGIHAMGICSMKGLLTGGGAYLTASVLSDVGVSRGIGRARKRKGMTYMETQMFYCSHCFMSRTLCLSKMSRDRNRDEGECSRQRRVRAKPFPRLAPNASRPSSIPHAYELCKHPHPRMPIALLPYSLF